MDRPTDGLRGFSKALFSTWFYHQPDRTLYDCGEGVATALRSECFGIERVFLSHMHLDHITGLAQLLFARSAGHGDKTKPLTVFYPDGDVDVHKTKTYLGWMLPDLPFPLRWEPLKAGQEVNIGRGKAVRAFVQEHDRERPCYGFQTVERRKKLLPQHVGKTAEEIKALGPAAFTVQEVFEFVYSGDTIPFGPERYRGARLMAHECTFINPDDSKRAVHTALPDVLDLAREANPKALLLYHFSTRYSAAECQQAVADRAARLGLPFPVWMQYGRHLWDAYRPEEACPVPDPGEAEVTTEVLAVGST